MRGVLTPILLLLALAGCGSNYVPIPGALPTPLETARAVCKTGTFSVDPNCMVTRGWIRDGDQDAQTFTRPWAPDPSVVVMGVRIGGLSAVQISDTQIHCLLDVDRLTGYRPILSHVADPYTGLYSDSELTNGVFPNDAEAALLAGFTNETDRCNWHMLSEVVRSAPRFSAILHRRWVESKMISIRLINRRITFGEAARQQHASIQKAKDAIIHATRGGAV